MRYARLPSVALLLICGWFAAGCVNDENGLSIVHFLHLDKTANNCAADPASMVIETQGTLDVGVAAQTGNGFFISPVLVNNLIVQTATNSPVNTIFVTGFDIELHPDPADANTASVLPVANRKYHIPAAGGALFPGGGGQAMTASEVAMSFEAINGDIARLLLPTLAMGMRDPLALTVRLRPVGTHSGVVINGGWVNYPVFICNDCLLDDIGPCPMGGVAPASIRQVCNASQDIETCCESGSTLLCGSAVPMKTM